MAGFLVIQWRNERPTEVDALSAPYPRKGKTFSGAVEREKERRRLLRSIGYSAVIFADPKVGINIATSDDTFSDALARAREKTPELFGDPDSETMYVGDKEEIEGLYHTVGLKPVEIILGENRRLTLLSVTERSGSFAFNICLSGKPELTQVITVEALNDLHPRAAL